MLTLVPGSNIQLVVASDLTVRSRHIKDYIAWVVTAGCKLTFPSGTRDNAHQPVRIVNTSASPVGLVFSTTSYEVVQPGQTVDVMCVRQATGTFVWTMLNSTMPDDKWCTWTPTVTQTGGPATVTTVARYKIVDGLCLFDIHISTADGAGTTAITITPPVVPSDTNSYWACQGTAIVAGTATDALGWIDCLHDTYANRLIQFRALPAFTDDAACSLHVSGFYETSGFDVWTSTLAYTGGSPTMGAQVGRYKVIDGLCFFNLYLSDTDPDGVATAMTATLPVEPAHLDVNIPVHAVELQNATYSNPVVYIDTTQATAASRVLTTNKLDALVDGEAIQLYISGCYPVAGSSYGSDVPVGTYTTGTPGSAATNFKGATVKSRGFGFICGSTTSTDGNGCTAVTVAIPGLVGKYAARHIALAAQELVNATYTNACGYVNADSTTVSDRATVQFSAFSTATDAQAWALRYAGILEL